MLKPGVIDPACQNRAQRGHKVPNVKKYGKGMGSNRRAEEGPEVNAARKV